MNELNVDSISLDLLRTLVVFSEAGTVEAAAQKLGMTQAGVSLQLKKLEDQLGATLFRTVGRKKALTDLARDLCQSVAPPLRDFERRLAEVRRRSADPQTRILRVGARAEIFPKLLDLVEEPGRLILRAMGSAEALSALRDDRIDMAILAEPPMSGEFISRGLFEESIVLAIPSGWSAVSTWEELETSPPEFLARPAAGYKTDPPYLQEIAACWTWNFDMKFVCEDWNAIGKLVSMGKAWAAMPEGLAPADVTRVVVPSRVLRPVKFHAVYGRHLRGLDTHLKKS